MPSTSTGQSLTWTWTWNASRTRENIRWWQMRNSEVYCFSNRLLKFFNSLIKGSGDGQHRRFANLAFELLQIFLGNGFVHFVGHHEARLVQQRRIVKLQFVQELPVVVPRQAAVDARHVEQEHQNFAA